MKVGKGDGIKLEDLSWRSNTYRRDKKCKDLRKEDKKIVHCVRDGEFDRMKKAKRRIAFPDRKSARSNTPDGRTRAVKTGKTFPESSEKNLCGKARESANELLLFCLSCDNSLIRSLFGNSLYLSLRSAHRDTHWAGVDERVRKEKCRCFGHG